MGSGADVAVGMGVAVGAGGAVGTGLDVAVGIGVGSGVAVGTGVDVAVGMAVGSAVAVGTGVSVGVGMERVASATVVGDGEVEDVLAEGAALHPLRAAAATSRIKRQAMTRPVINVKLL